MANLSDSLGCVRPMEKKGKEGRGKQEMEARNYKSGFDRGSRKACLGRSLEDRRTPSRA